MLIMKNIIFTLFLAISTLSYAAAQSDSLSMAKLKEEIKREVIAEINAEQKAAKKSKHGTTLNLYGFIRNYIHYDTRQCVAMTGELFNVMPMDVELNEDGKDLNDVPKMVFVSFTSRLGVDVAGPTIFNAASSAKLEADFCGFSPTNTLFRIRHAYVQLAWERTKILLGQTWHPSFQVAPTASSYSAGAPFATSSRSPQVSLTYDAGKKWELFFAALHQVPDASYGPNGKSYDYARWNVWPELYASITHKGNHLLYGAGVNILSLMPRKSSTALRQTTNTDGTISTHQINVPVKDRVLGVTAEAFADYKYGKFNLKGKFIYAENATHLTMLGGFGATSYDPETGSYEYAPIRVLTSWINATYGKKVVAGLFLGYADNIGSKKDFISTDEFWAFGAKNVDYLYRFAPSVTYFAKNLELSLEGDYTVAGYGDLAIDANTKALRDVSNLRMSLMVRYRF
jgi:hypothetical protein